MEDETDVSTPSKVACRTETQVEVANADTGSGAVVEQAAVVAGPGEFSSEADVRRDHEEAEHEADASSAAAAILDGGVLASSHVESSHQLLGEAESESNAATQIPARLLDESESANAATQVPARDAAAASVEVFERSDVLSRSAAHGPLSPPVAPTTDLEATAKTSAANLDFLSTSSGSGAQNTDVENAVLSGVVGVSSSGAASSSSGSP
ncbi:unnamed protein product, partial [Amoebophrya sp. A25]|eukprot:GSA25T00013213001.1